VVDQNAGLRERRAAVGFVLEVLDAAARAEGFASYRDSDWSPDVGDIIDRLAAALAPTERERALLHAIQDAIREHQRDIATNGAHWSTDYREGFALGLASARAIVLRSAPPAAPATPDVAERPEVRDE
jgi:hypothetical protein